MLEIKNINKVYETSGYKQIALNDVSLNFRNNEFVSILGPSGSGKTTLLNIIGGLDKYDSGDLIINNISTKKYKSKDWDSYRNHTVGFVFQSYNLIPHQTILSNVELALTISGVSKKARRKRALEALEQVGLKEQAHKRPNQMSGGQMQRVAVARALVNNPDILLADEPTGALDSETSLQVMDLLSKIAKDRLVIMVTHNPELAEEYSTRIVRLKDGKITDDSNPYKIGKNTKVEKYKNLGKSSMSIMTAFGLSLNNLLTKKGRTILTSFAGSIGIIGIALILSLSNGFKKYIDKVQEDALTSYPLTIERETANTTSILLSAVMKENNDKVEKGKVKETKNIEKMMAAIGKNDMKSFKKYIEDNSSKVDKMVQNIEYRYSVLPYIYTKNVNNEITRINPSDIMTTLTGGMDMSSYGMSVFQELVSDENSLEKTYTIVEGRMPTNYDEVVIFLPDENHISDLLLYTLGLKDSKNLDDMISKIMSGEKVKASDKTLEFTYSDLMNIELKLVKTTDLYQYNSNYNIYEDMSEDKDYVNRVYTNSVRLKVVGILKPKDTNNMSSLASGVGYTNKLTKYIIEEAEKTEIVKKQLNDKEINVFSGKGFDVKDDSTGLNFEDMITVDTEMLSSAFNMKIDENYIKSITSDYMGEISSAITVDTTEAQGRLLNNLSEIFKNLLTTYIEQNEEELLPGVAKIKLEDIDNIVDNYLNNEDVNWRFQSLENDYIVPKDTYKAIYQGIIANYLKMYVNLMSANQEEKTAMLASDAINTLVDPLVQNEEIVKMTDELAKKMVEATMQKTILTKVSELVGRLMESMANSFNVDQAKIAGAFKFNLTEDDMKRIFKAMSATSTQTDASTNLLKLGYQDIEEPTTMSFYFKNFDSKEKFMDFLDDYNKKMKKTDKNKVIEYTDLTGIMISSVKVIVDSVSYVLIAFVSISLIVSSIMIGIITYISVLERTKEIGILRAIGASKKNISSIFNAETFIVGFLSGLIGVGVSLLLLIPINSIIHNVTNNPDITAILPTVGGIVLIILSTVLTLIGGLIPSKKAAKQDPVLALRSE